MLFQIWYMRPDYFRDGILGVKWLMSKDMIPNPRRLDRSHVFLREIEASSVEQVFALQQAEAWSPNGEAQYLIRRKGLKHTSMSVGDIVVDENDNVYLCDIIGFKHLRV